VYVTVAPALTGSGESVIESARSASGVTVALTFFVLFAAVGSVSFAATLTKAETLESVVR